MGTTGQKPKKKQSAANNADHANKEASGKARGRKTDEDGFESLRVAAEKQLGQRGGKIAEALGKKAADGDLNSAKFLVAVSEKKERNNTRRKRDGLSVAERLALEPPWEEPAATEENSDAGSGEAAR